MFLLDTNILLELLLNQPRADEVENLLRRVPRSTLHLTDFTLYSLGIRLIREKRPADFTLLVEDLLIRGRLPIIRLPLDSLKNVTQIAVRLRLDFDDAYQHTAAELRNLTIVSFDAHFDYTPLGRKTPDQILADL